ncbi:hypothetical protein BBP40_005783 [Aspergillus hancockii]|nr:hypothetical protein BBP40_005783 [Aspergillus hancockii]
MSDIKAIVRLYPLDVLDVLPYRSLAFTSDSEHVDIGRASKREKKNLIPTNHNGLFDSRVMSRDHAKLHVCLEKKAVYLSDGGSMHGTWVNGEKIPVGEDTTINSGDEVVFGTEVIRGHETFPPLRVRFEHQWLGSGDELVVNTSSSYQVKRATNTFCVPDDDDDDYDNEIIYDSVPAVTAVETSSELADSDSGLESEDDSIMEISSPITSPPKAGDSVGSQYSPIDLDSEKAEQPLATPRMTPPLAVDVQMVTNHESRDEQSHAVHNPTNGLDLVSDARSVAESCDWEGEDDDQVGSEDESMSESQSEYDGEESDPDRISVRLSPVPFLTVHQGQQATATCDGYDDLPSDSDMKGKQREAYTPDLAYHTGKKLDITLSQDKAPSLDEQSSSWSVAAKDKADSDLPLQPRGKLFDHTMTGFHCDAFTQAMEDWQSHAAPSPTYLLPDHFGPRIPYKDGPFVNLQPHLVESNNRTDTIAPVSAGTEDAPPHTLVESSQMEAGIPTDMGLPCEQDRHICAPPKDIVDPSSSEVGAARRQPLKRKAMEAKLDVEFQYGVPLENICFSAEASSPVNNKPAIEGDESCFPDAQLQITVPSLGNSSSQLTELSAAQHSQNTDSCTLRVVQEERPSKRARTSGATNFRSHAATAVLGAVVGAVGTVAVLASLPAEYFS